MADRGIDITKYGADGIERLYDDGRIDKKDVVRWCRLSAKLSGRIYTPGYIDGRFHDYLKLRRREDLENRLFAKKAGYWRSRRTSRDPERTSYRVTLRFVRGKYRLDDGFVCEVRLRGRVVGRGTGVTAARAFYEAQRKAGIRGSYVIPSQRRTRWGHNELFSGRTVSFRESMA